MTRRIDVIRSESEGQCDSWDPRSSRRATNVEELNGVDAVDHRHRSCSRSAPGSCRAVNHCCTVILHSCETWQDVKLKLILYTAALFSCQAVDGAHVRWWRLCGRDRPSTPPSQIPQIIVRLVLMLLMVRVCVCGLPLSTHPCVSVRLCRDTWGRCVLSQVSASEIALAHSGSQTNRFCVLMKTKGSHWIIPFNIITK